MSKIKLPKLTFWRAAVRFRIALSNMASARDVEPALGYV